MTADLQRHRRRGERRMVATVILILLTLAGLLSSSPLPVSARAECVDWHWFVGHDCGATGVWCHLGLILIADGKVSSYFSTILGTYHTEAEARRATCAQMSDPFNVSGPTAVYPGVKATIGGEVYDVGTFISLDAKGQVTCYPAQPDADNDGVPDKNDRETSTPAGAQVNPDGSQCTPPNGCKAWCQDRFDKYGVEDARLHAESSSGTPPDCQCWCEVEGVGLTDECFKPTRDCDKECRQKYGSHAEWDGSDAEHCTQCICETGWKMENDKCVSCSKICTRHDSRAQHDPDNSRPEFCACKCDEQKNLEYNDETGKCQCTDHTLPRGNQCICQAGWEPRATAGCRQCPRHAVSDPGQECRPKPGFKWRDSSRQELVCDESAGYYRNSDRSDCLLVRGASSGWADSQKLIDAMTDPAGPNYTLKSLPPGTAFSARAYPPGTIVLWDLGTRPRVHSTMIVDTNGLQIEMGEKARTFVTTPSPTPGQVESYVPSAVLIPPANTQVKLPKMLKLVGMDRYDGNDWNCHGFMRSLKPYVAIPDPAASLPTGAHSMPGSSATIMKDPPGIPLTLVLHDGALYGSGLELHAFLPGGFAELAGDFLVEVNKDGSSRLSVADGEAAYYADGDADGVLIAPEQALEIQNGQPAQLTAFDSAGLDLWWVESEESSDSGISLGLPLVALAGTLLIGGLIASRVVRRRQPPARTQARSRPPDAPWASLALVQPGAAPRRLDLRHPVLTIGRGRANDLPLPDGRISRQHARIERRRGGAILTDLGSSNGTYLNGQRIRGPQRLHPGDVVRLGHTELIFQPGVQRRHPPAPGAPVPLVLDRSVLTIGRSSSCDLVLPDSSVSRHHAEIRLRAEGGVLSDLGSRNGTYINGQRVVGSCAIQPGDVIRIGNTQLVVQARDVRQ